MAAWLLPMVMHFPTLFRRVCIPWFEWLVPFVKKLLLLQIYNQQSFVSFSLLLILKVSTGFVFITHFLPSYSVSSSRARQHPSLLPENKNMPAGRIDVHFCWNIMMPQGLIKKQYCYPRLPVYHHLHV